MPEHQQTQKSTESKSTFQKQATPRTQAPVSHPMAIIQRARMNPKSLTHADVMQLQRTIGNRAVVRLLTEIGAIPSKAKQAPPVQRQELVQRQEIPEEEEPLQGKMAETVQRQEIPEEEEPLQGMFENNPDQMACPSCFEALIVQRQEIPEEEEPLQGKFETIQRQEIPEEEEPLQPKRENNTGMPDNLKAGVENLSGIDMSDVRVHYNSSKPAEVGALAYTQGTNIHVAPGQEKHLPHEAWHVVQQAQGRVYPTVQMKEIAINDDAELEKEADEMGGKATHQSKNSINTQKSEISERKKVLKNTTIQKTKLQDADNDLVLHEQELDAIASPLLTPPPPTSIYGQIKTAITDPDGDAAEGLAHWAKETKEAAHRKYDELLALYFLGGHTDEQIRLGKNNTDEPDIINKNEWVEVKTSDSADPNGIQKLIDEAVEQLIRRQTGKPCRIILYLLNSHNPWPFSIGEGLNIQTANISQIHYKMDTKGQFRLANRRKATTTYQVFFNGNCYVFKRTLDNSLRVY